MTWQSKHRDHPVEIRYFTNEKDITPKRQKVSTWGDLGDKLHTHQERRLKCDAGLISPTRYADGATRAKENVLNVSCFVIDLDKHPLESIGATLQPYEYIAHTTHSHRPDAERWRVWMPLAKPIPGHAWPAAWHALNAATGGLNDPQCKDASRIYYVPSHAPDATCSVIHNPGMLIDADIDTTPPRSDTMQQVDDAVAKWRNRDKTSSRREIMMPLTMRLESLRRKAAIADVQAIEVILRNLEQDFIDAPPPPGHATETRRNRQHEWQGMVAEIGKKLDADDKRFDELLGHPEIKKEHKSDIPKDALVIRVTDTANNYDRFVIGDNGEPLAVPRTGSPIARPLNSRQYRAELMRRYRDTTGSIANASAIDAALDLLYADALVSDDENVYLRLARLTDRVIIDRAAKNAGDVIEITKQGIKVLDTSPVLFRRTKLLAELAKPGEPNLDALREFANMREHYYQLFIGWMIGALLDIPLPMLTFEGDPGSGKSSFARVIKQIIDPSPVAMISPPRDPQSWRVHATNTRLIILDNVNHVPRWLADSLARIVTGDGESSRTLYTDNEPAVYQYRRPVIITAVRLDYRTAEIAQRLLLLRLDPITPQRRRTETELDQHLKNKLPNIIGGLLDLLAQVIDTLETMHEPDDLPRMGDFGKVLMALDQVTGWHTIDTYRERVTNAETDIGNSDEFISALVNCMRTEPLPGVYTASDLYRLTKPDTGTPYDFPGNARAVGLRLSQSIASLESRGLKVTNLARTGSDRSRWQFERLDDANDANLATLSLLQVETKETTARHVRHDAR